MHRVTSSKLTYRIKGIINTLKEEAARSTTQNDASRERVGILTGLSHPTHDFDFVPKSIWLASFKSRSGQVQTPSFLIAESELRVIGQRVYAGASRWGWVRATLYHDSRNVVCWITPNKVGLQQNISRHSEYTHSMFSNTSCIEPDLDRFLWLGTRKRVDDSLSDIIASAWRPI
jgi:hypothetical protein